VNAVSWSILIMGSGALVLALLERRFAFDRRRGVRNGFWNDLFAYAILQSWLLGIGITAILDFFRAHAQGHWIGRWPLALQVAFFVVSHDLYIYWFHRLQHRSNWLWRTHEAHHSVDGLDWVAGARSHSLEILINQTVEYLPMVLLGASAAVPAIKGTVSALWGMYIHSNLDVRTGRLQYVINGPEMHRWHHAVDTGQGRVNFATKLAIWDWLFGTAYRPAGERPVAYGMPEVPYPRGWLRQHLFAFRRFS
jgi:sterol desaturase/sphingolipid hydroxylase (fatty acid hydroxylase superfamily)